MDTPGPDGFSVWRPAWTVCPYFPEGTVVYQFQRLKQRGPEQALQNTKALYEKAEKHNQDLSDDEVGRLMSTRVPPLPAKSFLKC